MFKYFSTSIIKNIPLSHNSKKCISKIPLSLEINNSNYITKINIPIELKNKTIHELLLDNNNYSFYIDKNILLKSIKQSKPNNIFLL